MRFISLIRCSTRNQYSSHLGIEAQRASVDRYIKAIDGAILIDEFVEVGSGRKKKRPVIEEALRQCKKRSAVLLVAKIDRLARSVSFISGLTDKKIPFISIDQPNCDEFTVHLYSAFAQKEAVEISRRTKDALAAAKARGVKLGTYAPVLAKKNKDEADAFAKTLAVSLKEGIKYAMDKSGKVSHKGLADYFNSRKIKTAREGKWHNTTIRNLCKRLGVDIKTA